MRKILIAILFLISANAYCQFDGIIPSTPITLSSLPAGIFTTSNLDTTKIFFNDQNNSVTGRNIFSDKQSFTDTLDVNKLIADSITVGFINGSAYNPFDSSQYVKRSAFSQSITATGGDMTFSSSLGGLLLNGSTVISLGSSGDMQFSIANGSNFKFLQMPTVAGGVTSATVGGYITVSIVPAGGDEPILIDLWYNLH